MKIFKVNSVSIAGAPGINRIQEVMHGVIERFKAKGYNSNLFERSPAADSYVSEYINKTENNVADLTEHIYKQNGEVLQNLLSFRQSRYTKNYSMLQEDFSNGKLVRKIFARDDKHNFDKLSEYKYDENGKMIGETRFIGDDNIIYKEININPKTGSYTEELVSDGQNCVEFYNGEQIIKVPKKRKIEYYNEKHEKIKITDIFTDIVQDTENRILDPETGKVIRIENKRATFGDKNYDSAKNAYIKTAYINPETNKIYKFVIEEPKGNITLLFEKNGEDALTHFIYGGREFIFDPASCNGTLNNNGVVQILNKTYAYALSEHFINNMKKNKYIDANMLEFM